MSKVIKRSLADGTEVTETPYHHDGSQKRAPIIRSEIADARGEAGTILDKARAEADAIKRQAHDEAERIKAEAKAEGYAEGREEGAQELTGIVAEVSQRLSEKEAQAEPQLRILALAIAKKVLGRELEFHPDAVVDIVKQALAEKARQRREILLRINPEDMQFIRDHKADLLEVLSRAKEIGIREDPDVSRHGVVIETDAGIIDAQLETQLEVLERKLKGL
jgi:type III secretion protein L